MRRFRNLSGNRPNVMKIITYIFIMMLNIFAKLSYAKNIESLVYFETKKGQHLM